MTQENMAQDSNPIEMDARIMIAKEPAQVFEFWRAMENFPRFMEHVKEVRATGNNRYHWRVDGIAGIDVTWEADVTDMVPNEQISWRSVSGSTIDNAGTVEFKPMGAGETELHVHLSYAPPAGKLGHAVASLFGMNPEQQIGDDLQRCKELLEQGIASNHEGTVTRDEVMNTGAVEKPH